MKSTGQTAVVTGAGSGVGRAIALKFAAEGWKVALVGRGVAALEETRALASPPTAPGVNVQHPVSSVSVFPCDVQDAVAVDAMAAAVLEQFGHVDVLVNSAGINVRKRALREVSLDDWNTILFTNLHGAFYCVRAFLASMRARGSGTIVNINSDTGKIARDLAGVGYVTSKFGMTGLAQAINAEERAHGIRACSIFPRDVNTPLLDKRPQPPSAEVRAKMIQPEDMAACVWLAATMPHQVIVEEIFLSTR